MSLIILLNRHSYRDLGWQSRNSLRGVKQVQLDTKEKTGHWQSYLYLKNLKDNCSILKSSPGKGYLWQIS